MQGNRDYTLWHKLVQNNNIAPTVQHNYQNQL